jgi:hypothetical protein
MSLLFGLGANAKAETTNTTTKSTKAIPVVTSCVSWFWLAQRLGVVRGRVESVATRRISERSGPAFRYALRRGKPSRFGSWALAVYCESRFH